MSIAVLKTLIIYYSRTGTTAQVAQTLADTLQADVLKITCPRYRLGWFRYLLAGYDSVHGKLPMIRFRPVELSQYDHVILAAPIWTSYPALPLRAFLGQGHGLPEHTTLVLTFGGHSEPQKAVAMVRDLLDAEIKNVLTVHQDDLAQPDFAERIKRFADQLRDQKSETDTHDHGQA